MVSTVSVSDLRAQIRSILNKVGYGQSEYIINKFGEPIAAIISMEDYQMLQECKEKRAETLYSDASSTLSMQLQAIHEKLSASGYQTRTKQEIDAQLNTEREDWEG